MPKAKRSRGDDVHCGRVYIEMRLNRKSMYTTTMGRQVTCLLALDVGFVGAHAYEFPACFSAYPIAAECPAMGACIGLLQVSYDVLLAMRSGAGNVCHASRATLYIF